MMNDFEKIFGVKKDDYIQETFGKSKEELFQEFFGMKKEKLLESIKSQKLIVSISGMDNLGKSTQAGILNEIWPEMFSKPMHINQTEAFPKLKGKELSLWWFDPNNYKEFADTMYHSIAQRYEKALKSDAPIVVLDKGIDFYDTRIKATLLTLGVPQNEVLSIVKEAKNKYLLWNSCEDLKLIIVPSKDSQRTNLRKEEAVAETEDVHGKYLQMNIGLLNKKLEEGKTFTPVEFVENGASLMNKDIVEKIFSLFETKNQLQNAEKISKLAQDVFKDNLKLAFVGGSSGKGRYQKGWSDIDMYFIFDKLPHRDMLKFTQELPKVTNVHVGTTFYSLDDFKKLNVDHKTFVTLHEFGLGVNRVLYNSENMELPQVDMQDVKRLDERDLPNALNLLKREVYYSSNNTIKQNDRNTIGTKENSGEDDPVFNISKIIKTSTIVEKAVLTQNGVFTFNYLDTAREFARLSTEKLMQMKEMTDDETEKERYESMMKTLQDFDIVEAINTRNDGDKEKSDRAYEFGVNLLEVVDEMNCLNEGMEDK